MKKEIVSDTLRHRNVDIVPHFFGLTKGAAEKLQKHYGDEYEKHLNNYLRIYFLDQPDSWEWVDDGVIQDLWGVQWDRSVDRDIGVPRNLIFPEPDMKYWNPPAIDERLIGLLEDFVSRPCDKFTVVSLSFFTLYDRAWTLRGIENFLIDMMENPRFANSLLDAITDWSIQAVESVLNIPGINAMLFPDDWGQQTGLVFGKKWWGEYLKPRLRRLFAAVKKSDVYISVHSCGRVQELFGDLIDLGLDLFNPFQPEVMNVPEMYAQYGSELSFWGGLSVQRTLPLGTPDEVKMEVSRLWEMGRGGGYILSPAHDIPSDVPIENLIALVETVRELEER